VAQIREVSDDKRGDGWTDDVVLQQAVQHRAAVITRNGTDFRALHKSTSGNHYGIVVCVFVDTADLKKVAKSIDAAIRQQRSLRGLLITVACQ